MTLEQLSWHVDDVIKRQLQATKGVGRVERYGGVDREIRVNLDPEKLLAYGITAAQVNQQVRATNVDLGSRPRRGRRPGAGDPHACRRAAGRERWPMPRSFSPAAARCASKISAASSTTPASSASFGAAQWPARRIVLDLPHQRDRASFRSPMRSTRRSRSSRPHIPMSS